jgi:hypothetical protein
MPERKLNRQALPVCCAILLQRKNKTQNRLGHVASGQEWTK